MSSLIPKEKLSAYQRWELASFDEPPPPTAAELAERLRKENENARRTAYGSGREEGYAAGLEQGRAAGFEQSRQAGFEQGLAQGLAEGRAQAVEEKAQLQRIAETFSAEVGGASDRIAADVLNLALDLSKAMLKNALQVRPELILPIVADAIRYLPTVQQPALLSLHPADAQLVKDVMGNELSQAGWRLIDDAHMQRGDCRVETATNQIDASIPTRWQRLAAALGSEAEWLAP